MKNITLNAIFKVMCCVSILIVFQSNLNAQDGGVKGCVIDSISKDGIESVLVILREKEFVTSTDLMGKFNLPNLAEGEYEIQLLMIGYDTKVVQVNVIQNQSASLEINLSPAPMNITQVEISQRGSIGSEMQRLNMIDISLRPLRSAQDVLKMIPGLVIAQHAGGGKAEQIFLRGFDIDHGTDIRLAVDGMPVNMVSHAHGQGYSDLHFLIPETIDRVDFNKGPYYASKGDFTTAGYASFETKKSLDKSMVKMEGGQFDSFRVVSLVDVLDKNAAAKNQHAYIASEYIYNNGYFESPQNFNRINLSGKYHGVIAQDKILTLSLSTFRSEWDASGQVPERAIKNGMINRFGSIDNKEGGSTSRTNANLRLTKILNISSNIQQQFFLVSNAFELYSNFTFFLNDSINGDQIKQKENRKIYGYNASYVKNSTIKSLPLKSEVGVQLRFDDINNIELSHTAQRKILITPFSLGQINQFNAGVYLDETLEISERFTLNAALRYDQFRFDYRNDLDTNYNRKINTSKIFSPKFSLFFNANESLQLYFKAGTGFHSNDTRVAVLDSTNQTLPRAFGFDLGVFYKPVNRILMNAAIWGLDLQQEFVYVGDEAIVEASGYSRRYGFDFSLRYQVLNWLYLDADVNRSVAKAINDPEGENHIPLAPTITSIGGITIKFEKGFNMSLRYRYVGDRAANPENTIIAKGYSLIDAVIGYNQPSYSIGISIENVLNAEWNEAQFDTESKLKNEVEPVSELHFTPGIPFFAKMNVAFYF